MSKPSVPEDRSVYDDGTPTCPVVIVHSNKNDGKTFHVHAAECGDSVRYHDDADAWDFPTEVRDKRDVVDDTYGPGAGSFYTESGWDTDAQTEAERNETAWVEYLHDFKFFPCVSLPEDIGGLRWTEEDEVGTATVSVDGVVVAVTKHVDLTEPEVAYDGPASEGESTALNDPEHPDYIEEPDVTVEPLVGGAWVRITDKVEGDSIDVHRTDIPALIAALANALVQEATS